MFSNVNRNKYTMIINGIEHTYIQIEKTEDLERKVF